jgi:hypothetical protein
VKHSLVFTFLADRATVVRKDLENFGSMESNNCIKKAYTTVNAAAKTHLVRKVEISTKIVELVVGFEWLVRLAIDGSMIFIILVPFKETKHTVFHDKTDGGKKRLVNVFTPFIVLFTRLECAQGNAKADSASSRRTGNSATTGNEVGLLTLRSFEWQVNKRIGLGTEGIDG